MKIRYLLPKKIIDFNGKFSNLDSLLECKIDQPSFKFGDNFKSDDGGYIVLDFGEEINGGIRIVNQGSGKQDDNNLIHVRFGESVSEVMHALGEFNSTNNHSPRDIEYLLPDFSKIEFGDTGFRFVRIDFPKGINQRIYSINAISKEIDNIQIGCFKSNDEQLNKIFDVAARTARLCVLDYIVDGVKRDRLVWAGDLLIELKSLNYLFGNLNQVEKTFNFLEETNSINDYMQNMPTYNLWYLSCLNEYFKLNGLNSFLLQKKTRVDSILSLIKTRVTREGLISFDGVDYVAYPYFIDWRTSDNELAKQSNPCFYLYLLNECKNLIIELDLEEKFNDIINYINKFEPKLMNVSQFDCFSLLSNKGNKEKVIESILSSREKQFSPFSYYFVLKALFESNPNDAIEMFKNYNMGMINLGATTFFEEFEYSWKDSVKIDELPNGKFNFLTDSGDKCYKGLRKSLCHGWASSPVSFIIENIVGFKGTNGNCVYLKPYIEGLSSFESTFVCSLGTINVKFDNGKFTVNTPNNIKYVIL